VIASAYWLSGRAVHRAITGVPQIELELGTPKQNLHSATRAIRDAVSALCTVEPWDDTRVINLFAGAFAVARSGAHPDWMPALTALTGAAFRERLPPTARLFVSHRWSAISLLSAELMFERRASVRRVMELCGVNVKEFA
jgi:hypothetical protein